MHLCRVLTLFTVITLLSSPSLAESDEARPILFPDYNVGKTAYKNKDYATAYQNWLPIAEAGFPKAKTQLGKLYARGLGVQKDAKLAYGLFRNAYKNGDGQALVEIGRLYEKGNGTPVNIAEARNWYQRAADEGNPRGDYLIGMLYQKKKLSPYYGAPTPETSKSFITESLNDFKKKKFERAEALADMYRLGLHVQQDFKKALVLMLVAEKYGSRTARRKARILETKVNYDDFVEAPKLANNIYSGHSYGKKTIKKYSALKDPEETFYQKAEREAEASYYFQKSADSGYKRAQKKLIELAYKEESEHNKENHAKTEIASFEIKKRYRIKGTLKTQYTFDDNLDLDTNGARNESATVADAVIGTYLYPTENISAYVEGRGFTSTGNAQSNTDDDDEEVDQSFFEIRQAWVEFDQVGHPLLSLKVGRQRFYEPNTTFWNRDFDAVRLSLNSTLNKGFIAFGENLTSYRTGKENEFQGEDEKRFRVLGEFEHHLNHDHQVSARFTYENDHSGLMNTGTVINETERDDDDFNLLWAGVRSNGAFVPKENKNIKKIIYTSDLMAVIGEEELNTSTSIAGTNQRTITGSQARDVFGWAFDGKLSFLLDNKMRTALTFGYAYGSGDENANSTGTNNAFRQTGLNGNASRYPYGFTNETTRNYGEVLRPELSNLHILNFGAHMPIFGHSDMGMNYFNYWLDKEQTGLRSASITAQTNGTDRYLGQELDFSANIYLGKELNLENAIMNQTTFRLRLGMFVPSDAFNNSDRNVYRGTGELRFKF